MADGLNRVMLLGNVGTEPELRSTNSGTSVLKFSLATNESYVDRNRVRQESVEWHKVVIWGKRGEGLSRYVSKGTKLFVEGKIRTSSYEDRDGNKRYMTEIVASNVLFAGGNDRQSRQRDPEPEQETGGYQYDPSDDIPF
jgi:single-strand DNA-binding protein